MKSSTGTAVRLHRNAVRDRPDSLSAFKWNACPPSPESAKMEHEHRVPLGDRTIDLLRSLPTEQGNPFMFIGAREGKQLSNMALAEVVRGMNDERTRAGLPRYVDAKRREVHIIDVHQPGFVSRTVAERRSIYDEYDASVSAAWKNLQTTSKRIVSLQEGEAERQGSPRNDKQAAYAEYEAYIANAWRGAGR